MANRWRGYWRRWGTDLTMGTAGTTPDAQRGLRGATAAKHADVTLHSDVAHGDAGSHGDHTDGKVHGDDAHSDTAHSDTAAHTDALRFR